MDELTTHQFHLELQKINQATGSKVKINSRFEDIILATDVSENLILDADPYTTTQLHCNIRINKASKKFFIAATLPSLERQVRGEGIFMEGIIEAGQWSQFLPDQDLKTLEYADKDNKRSFKTSIFIKSLVLKRGSEVLLPVPGSNPLSLIFSNMPAVAPPAPTFNAAIPPPSLGQQLQPSPSLHGPVQQQQIHQSAPPSTLPADRQAALAAAANTAAQDRQLQAAQAEIKKKNEEVEKLMRAMEDLKIQMEVNKKEFSKQVEDQVKARTAMLAPPAPASILLHPASTTTAPSSTTTITTTSNTTPSTTGTQALGPPEPPPAPAGLQQPGPGGLPAGRQQTPPLPADEDDFQTPMVRKTKKRRANPLSPAGEGEEEVEEVEEEEEKEKEEENVFSETENGEDSDGIIEGATGGRKDSLFENSNPFASQEILDGVLEKIKEAIDQGNQSDPEPLVAAVQLLLPKITTREEADLLSDYIEKMADSISQQGNLSQNLKTKIRNLGSEILKVTKKIDQEERLKRAAEKGARKKIIPSDSIHDI